MKASYILSYGGKEAVKYGDLPDPVINENQVLVEVRSVSLNPVDYKIKSGAIRFITGSKFPKILGTDYAGVIRSTGSGITGFSPGDRIYGPAPIIFGKAGSLAELMAVESKYARKIPDGMSFEDASSIPVAGLTALNGLRKCGVKQGSTVLINGATGGVGHFAVQIAKAKGAFVTSTCRQSNSDLARKLGSDEVMGYSGEEIASIDRKFDSIFDAYGKMAFSNVCRLLKRNGVYASPLFFGFSYVSAFFVRLVLGKKLTSSNLRILPEDFDEIEKLYTEKKLKPVIERTFTLENAAEAFAFAESGKPRGKIIVKI
jgi:NADPH:quinone reductase-like Zn-dependent oxidoreductase